MRQAEWKPASLIGVKGARAGNAAIDASTNTLEAF
jgi:hypothetical protein